MAVNNNNNNSSNRSGNRKEKKGRKEKQETKPKPASTGSRSIVRIVISAIIIVAIVGTALMLVSYNPSANQQASFSTFMDNFMASNSVAIYVSSANMSAYPSAIACATALIEVIEANAATHKNTSDIGFYVMNQSACIYKANGLGSTITNYTNTTPSACLALSASIPRILINYSSTNSTVIRPYDLYVSGTPSFLNECGIASVIK